MANNNASSTTDEIKVKIPKHREFTALHEAVMDEQVLPKLLDRIKKGESKIDVSGANERNETPLHYAVYHKKLNAIEPLVAAGAKVNKRTIGGDTPLSLGVQSNGAQAVKKLIDVCKSLNVRLDLNKGNLYGETPLHWACSYGRLALVKLLVESGANVDAKTATGETPLFMAQTNKQNECAEYLISKGATAPEPYKPKEVQCNLPSPIADGFVKHEWEHEMRFGGALWADLIEFFYTGKKPRPGYAIQINANFSAPQKDKSFTWFRGFIRTVEENKLSFEATVTLNIDHATVFPELNKDWNAKVQWVPTKQNPWVLISLTPIDPTTQESKTFDRVFEASKKLEEKYGRSLTREPQGAFSQMAQANHPHSHSHDHGGHDHDHSHGHGEECNDEHDHEHGEDCDHEHEGHSHGGHGHSHGHGGHREMPEEAHYLLKSDLKPGIDTSNIKVITAFHIDSLGEVEYTFLDGSTQSVKDPQKVPFLIQMMIMKSERAAAQGFDRVPLTFSQDFKQFAISMNMLSEDDLNEIGSVQSKKSK